MTVQIMVISNRDAIDVLLELKHPNLNLRRLFEFSSCCDEADSLTSMFLSLLSLVSYSKLNHLAAVEE